jgi:hypothetical protein
MQLKTNQELKWNRVKNVALALIVGALLGALATMPYEQLIGLSGQTSLILRSLVSTAVLAGFGTRCTTKLTFDISALQQKEVTTRL